MFTSDPARTRDALDVEPADVLDLRAQLVGLHVVAEPVRGGVVGDRDVGVARARAPPPPSPRSCCGRPRPSEWQWSSPRMSSSSTSSGSLRVARGLELAAVLAQLRRDPVHAEQLVDLLLGRARVRRLRRVVGDAVLRDVEAALDRRGAQRLVVLLRPGQVLEQVAEVLGRDDPQVDADAVVRDRARAGLPGRARLGDQRQRAERVRQRPRRRTPWRPGRCPCTCPSSASRCRRSRPGRRRAARAGRRAAPPRSAAPSTAAASASGARPRRRRARAGCSPRPSARSRWSSRRRCSSAACFSSSRDAIPISSKSLRARFGPEARQAGDLDEAGRVLRLQLLRRRDRPGVEQRVQLLLDRLADARAAR